MAIWYDKTVRSFFLFCPLLIIAFLDYLILIKPSHSPPNSITGIIIAIIVMDLFLLDLFTHHPDATILSPIKSHLVLDILGTNTDIMI